jgi:hypothetical protein
MAWTLVRSPHCPSHPAWDCHPYSNQSVSFSETSGLEALLSHGFCMCGVSRLPPWQGLNSRSSMVSVCERHLASRLTRLPEQYTHSLSEVHSSRGPCPLGFHTEHALHT